MKGWVRWTKRVVRVEEVGDFWWGVGCWDWRELARAGHVVSDYGCFCPWIVNGEQLAMAYGMLR
jgi:hypothetical protein